MRYLRVYPPLMQLLLFVLMVFTLFWFFTLIQLAVLPKLTSYTALQIAGIGPDSPPALIRTSLISQAISHSSIFLFPAILFAYLAHPRPAPYLGLRAPGRAAQWPAVTALMLGLLPMLLFIESVCSRLNMGAEADRMQAANEAVTKAYLNQQSPGGFLLAMFVIAVLPAIGEELFFRGVIMRFAHSRSKTVVFPVIISALLFTAVHFNPYGTVSIFVAAVVLALVYWCTGSIIASMWAHFLNNGLQVALFYMANGNPALRKALEANSLPALLVLGGAAVFGLSAWWLWKIRTPLPPTWSDDGGESVVDSQ